MTYLRTSLLRSVVRNISASRTLTTYRTPLQSQCIRQIRIDRPTTFSLHNRFYSNPADEGIKIYSFQEVSLFNPFLIIDRELKQRTERKIHHWYLLLDSLIDETSENRRNFEQKAKSPIQSTFPCPHFSNRCHSRTTHSATNSPSPNPRKTRYRHLNYCFDVRKWYSIVKQGWEVPMPAPSQRKQDTQSTLPPCPSSFRIGNYKGSFDDWLAKSLPPYKRLTPSKGTAAKAA